MTRRQPSAALRADDLTAKARIRNAALDLFAAHGAEATSLRAAAAGVTVGLIVHDYGTKEALREAVELAEEFADDRARRRDRSSRAPAVPRVLARSSSHDWAGRMITMKRHRHTLSR